MDSLQRGYQRFGEELVYARRLAAVLEKVLLEDVKPRFSLSGRSRPAGCESRQGFKKLPPVEDHGPNYRGCLVCRHWILGKTPVAREYGVGSAATVVDAARPRTASALARATGSRAKRPHHLAGPAWLGLVAANWRTWKLLICRRATNSRGVVPPRPGIQMHVVGHEAPPQQPDSCVCQVLLRKFR